MSRRERRHEQTRDEILAAAEDLVLSGDPEGITVHAVARAIDVTPGALYRYFPSRDAILAAVQARVLTDLAHALHAAVDDAGVPPLVRLRAAGRAMLTFAAASPHRYALLSRMLAVPRPLLTPEEAAPGMAIAVGVLAEIRSLFAEAREAGALGPGDDTARVLVLWAAIHGAVQLDKLSRYAPIIDGNTIGEQAIDALFVGWANPHWRTT